MDKTIFDKIIPRHNTNSLKYDFPAKYNKPADAVPLWVADMDFPIAEEITQAIQAYTHHGIYGYSEVGDSYFATLENWFKNQHDFHIQKDWLVKTPGIVYALAMAIQAYTKVGEGVLIQKPLYYPIEGAILANHRTVIDNTLVYKNGTYHIDFDDFEKKAAQAKIFILCNPHNPVGRVWTYDELKEMARIVKKYNLIVISDEIHQDLTFDNHKHLTFANITPDVKTITCTSPSKTFNLAGLQVSNIFIPDQNLRDAFTTAMGTTGYSQLNTLGLVACQAAYTHGLPWLTQLKDYLWQNMLYVKSTLADIAPQVDVIPLEGSYLLWLDFNKLGIPHDVLEDALLTKAGLWLSSGTTFGATGEGFFRINLACPRTTLENITKIPLAFA